LASQEKLAKASDAENKSLSLSLKSKEDIIKKLTARIEEAAKDKDSLKESLRASASR